MDFLELICVRSVIFVIALYFYRVFCRRCDVVLEGGDVDCIRRGFLRYLVFSRVIRLGFESGLRDFKIYVFGFRG